MEKEEEDEGIKAMEMDWIMASRVWAPNEGMQIQECIIVSLSPCLDSVKGLEESVMGWAFVSLLLSA